MANVSDITLLADSVYVQAFTNAAYKKTVNRIGRGIAFKVVGIIIGAAAIIYIIYKLSYDPKVTGLVFHG